MRIHELITDLKEVGTYTDPDTFDSVLKSIDNAQKFYIGDSDHLPRVAEEDGLENRPELPKLPYQLCLFELNVKQFSTPEMEEDKFFFRPCSAVVWKTNEVFNVHCFVYIIEYGCWSYVGTGRIDKSEDGKFELFTGFKKEAPSLLQLRDGSILDIPEGGLQTRRLFCNAIIRNVLLFLDVLNCSNVQTALIEASPKLNAKRARKGKLPLYSYHVLKLKRNGIKASLGGSHDSPRIHLRRGHIKRRKTGNFWWQPCVVGDRSKGVVMKEYSAESLSPKLNWPHHK